MLSMSAPSCATLRGSLSSLSCFVFPGAWGGGRVLHPSSLGQEAAEEAQALRMELLRQEIIPEFGSEIWRRCS
jgi:hypothetical protein